MHSHYEHSCPALCLACSVQDEANGPLCANTVSCLAAVQRSVDSLSEGLQATMDDLKDRFPTTKQSTALSMVDSNFWHPARGLRDSTGTRMPDLDKLLCEVRLEHGLSEQAYLSMAYLPCRTLYTGQPIAAFPCILMCAQPGAK